MSETKVTQTERDYPRKIEVYKQPTGTNPTTTSTALIDSVVSTTYTSGVLDETVRITVNMLLINSTTGATYIYLNVDGVTQAGLLYAYGPTSHWCQVSNTWNIDVDANDTVTVKLEWKVSGGTGSFSTSSSYHTPHIIMEGMVRQ